MKQDDRLLALLVPCGAMLLFGALTCSQTMMAGVAEMGSPLGATAKNVLGRSVIAAWAGVAGAVLFSVGMSFAAASTRAWKRLPHLLSIVGFLSGSVLIGWANIRFINTLHGIAQSELITASMVRERIEVPGHVILLGFVSIVAASVCMSAAVVYQKQRVTPPRSGWGRRFVLSVSSLLLIGGTCWIARSSSVFVYTVSQSGGSRLAQVAGCVSSVLLATFLILAGMLGYVVLTLVNRVTAPETREPSGTGRVTHSSGCTHLDPKNE